MIKFSKKFRKPNARIIHVRPTSKKHHALIESLCKRARKSCWAYVIQDDVTLCFDLHLFRLNKTQKLGNPTR